MGVLIGFVGLVDLGVGEGTPIVSLVFSLVFGGGGGRGIYVESIWRL